MSLAKIWPWYYAVLYSSSIALCIVIDILQYSAALSFLPQALKDDGHTAMEIAAVIGSYYWAGFLGGACITCYQLRRVIWSPVEKLTWSHIRCHVLNLIIGLLLGSVSLTLEGLYPTFWVHFFARLTQGFLGAFLFFFSFLLSIELFEEHSFQQLMALTMSSMALHAAEVFGPFIGAAIFVHYGLSMPFYVLAVTSLVNQLLLAAMWLTLPKDAVDPEMEDLTPKSKSLVTPDDTDTGWSGVKKLFTSAMLWRSVLVVAPAAMVKAGLESVLPLFADHRLRYDEWQVGICFTLVAIAFLTTSLIHSAIWNRLGHKGQTWLVTISMFCLSIVACTLLLSFMYGGPWSDVLVPDWTDFRDPGKTHKRSFRLFYVWLVLFGVASAGCFTPSAYLIGTHVDSLRDAAMKDASNAIWNTLWEVGGSLGLALGGIPSTRSWWQQELLMAFLGLVLCASAIAFFIVSGMKGAQPPERKRSDSEGKTATYGA